MFSIKKDETSLKIILLQLRKRHPIFMAYFQDNLISKRTRRSTELANELKKQFSVKMEKFKCKYIPRAKSAVKIRFFPKDNNIPALHNLVKFYLDPLRSVVFDDDRQISYLEACCGLPSQRSQKSIDNDASVSIEVERLVDYKRRFDLFFTLLEFDEFRNHLKEDLLPWDDTYRYLFDVDDERRTFGLYDSIWPDKNEKLSKVKEAFIRFEKEEYQKHLLSIIKLGESDRPDGPKGKYGKYYRKKYAELHDILPFTIDIGDLPSRGGSDDYKQRILERLRKLKEEWCPFEKFLVPVELDIQVTPRGEKLGKDLDNIVRDIVPAFKNELLEGEAYLHGYRIYSTGKFTEENSSGSIRIRILPMGAIRSFEDSMDKTLAAAERWLETRLSRFY